MKRTLLLSCVFILLIALFPMTLVHASGITSSIIKVYWGQDQLIEVSPGQNAILSILLRYEGHTSDPPANILANLSLPTGFSSIGGETTTIIIYSSEKMTWGTVFRLDFPIFISPATSLGNYTADLTLHYFVSQNTIMTDEMKIGYEVTGKPEIDVKAMTTSIQEGQQTLNLSILNKGSAPASNLKIEGLYASGASVELEGTDKLGDIEAGKEVIVPLHISGTSKNTILPLTVETSYIGPLKVRYDFSKILYLNIRPYMSRPALSISVTPSELTIGKQSQLSFQMENIGTSDLTDISIEVSSDIAQNLVEDSTMFIDKLAPSERKEILRDFYVPSTTTAPSATLKILTDYFDEEAGVVQNINLQLNVLLRGLSELSLTDMIVIPSQVQPGSLFSVILTVTNVGTSIAYTAYATPIAKDLPLRITGSRSAYIGNIETNLPTTTTISLQMGNTTESRVTLPIIVSYLDNLRSLHNITINVPIPIIPATSSSPTNPGTRPILSFISVPLLVVAIVVIGGVVFVLLRRRRR